MSVIEGLAGSLLAVLEHPRWWVLALAGFLVRGGLLLLLVPLVPIPTTAALANGLGPTLVGFVFGGASPSFIVLVGTVAGGLLLWLIVGGLAGAGLDLALIRAVATDEALPAGPAPDQAGPLRAAVVRWLAHLPTAAIVVWGASPLVDAAYQELLHPGDPTLPVPVRVILRVPQVVVLLLAAWAVGEAIGGLAVRHLAWGAGIARSFVQALGSLVRPSGILVLLLTDLAVGAAIGVGTAALAAAYDLLRIAVREGDPPVVVTVVLGLLSIAWLGALTISAIAASWRSAAWTVEVARRPRSGTDDPAAA
jgi:hypothetical protein